MTEYCLGVASSLSAAGLAYALRWKVGPALLGLIRPTARIPSDCELYEVNGNEEKYEGRFEFYQMGHFVRAKHIGVDGRSYSYSGKVSGPHIVLSFHEDDAGTINSGSMVFWIRPAKLLEGKTLYWNNQTGAFRSNRYRAYPASMATKRTAR